MPNGRGSLECCYCVHWRGESHGYDGAYDAGFCDYHKVAIPSTLADWGHRVCSDFSPSQHFENDSGISVEERFSRFGISLKPSMLYVFSYNSPNEIKEFVELKRKA